MDLDVEVAAELEPAEELDDRDLAQHHRGVALLPGEHPGSRSDRRPWASARWKRASLSGLRSRRQASRAPRITRQACGSCAASIGNRRTKIRIGEPADLGLMQFGVRRRPVGDRELVVLGRSHVGRLSISGGSLAADA